ncbi:MAG: zinc-binding dehydrogenase [Acidimicrobiia bacterium]|nr:zinc-binding dehydrogenase [Acidimicrobiia bacterium]
MRAVRLTAPNEIEVAELPDTVPTADLVLLEPEILGLCGTDIKVVHGDIPVPLPRALGHEVVGRVISNPTSVGPEPGTRVLVDPSFSCGFCHQCVQLRPHLCTNGGLMGRDVDGVFADLVAAPVERLHKVPESISDREAGLVQVLGTCVHGLRSPKVSPGDTAVVLGLGVAGQLMVQLLSAAGATVIGVTRSEEKRKLAGSHGASAVVAPDDTAELIADMTSGVGPELVVEAVGTEATLIQAIEWAATGGDVVMFGTPTGGAQGLPYYQLYFKELTLWCPRAALPEDYRRAIELVAAGNLDVAEIVTSIHPLDQVEEAFRSAEQAASLKVLVDPTVGR